MLRTTLRTALQSVEKGLILSAQKASKPGFVYPLIGTGHRNFHSADSTLAPRGGGGHDGLDEIRPRILITGLYICFPDIL